MNYSSRGFKSFLLFLWAVFVCGLVFCVCLGFLFHFGFLNYRQGNKNVNNVA